jgi:hypothetical protein
MSAVEIMLNAALRSMRRKTLSMATRSESAAARIKSGCKRGRNQILVDVPLRIANNGFQNVPD